MASLGIMKKGRPVVIARQPEAEALQELQKSAGERGCEIMHASDVVNLTSKVRLWEQILLIAVSSLHVLENACNGLSLVLAGHH